MKFKAFVVAIVFSLICGVAYCQCPNGNCGSGYYYPQFFFPFNWGWNYYGTAQKTCVGGNCANKPVAEKTEDKSLDEIPDWLAPEETAKTEETSADVTQEETTAENAEETSGDTQEKTAEGNPSLETAPIEEEKVVPIPEVVPLPENTNENVEGNQVAKTEETITIPPFTARVIELINAHRKQFGLPPLEIDVKLNSGCRMHSYFMASYGFQHAYNSGLECIAMGVNSPESLVNMWLNSSGHRAIIMSRGHKVGVGSYGTYHTLRVR